MLIIPTRKWGITHEKNTRTWRKRDGIGKAADGEFVTGGSILYRQRGTKIYPGKNVGIGSDDTVYAKISGVVKFERLGKDRKQVSVYPAE